MEKIVAAAIQFDAVTYSMPRPARHHTVIQALPEPWAIAMIGKSENRRRRNLGPHRDFGGSSMTRTEAIEALRALKDATPPEARTSDAVAILEEVLIAHGLADVVEAFRELEVEWA